MYALEFIDPDTFGFMLDIIYRDKESAQRAMDTYHKAQVNGKAYVQLPEDKNGQINLVPVNIPYFLRIAPSRG